MEPYCLIISLILQNVTFILLTELHSKYKGFLSLSEAFYGVVKLVRA